MEQVAARRRLWPIAVDFVLQEALSCVFPFLFFTLLAATKIVHVPGIPRYDLLLLGCLSIQAAMIWSRLETVDEAKTIALFHVLGLAMEVYKVHMGSWAYPEFGYAKIAGVPLYSGFMYASVGSYVCQAWRRMNLELSWWPPTWQVVGVGALGYLNFFTHHWTMDFRWPLFVLVMVVFRRVWVCFSVAGRRLRMPLVASFFLIGSFLWLAENIATYFGAWQYPYQREGWRLVDPGKVSSWSMLVIVSTILVAHLKHVKAHARPFTR